VAPLPLPPYPLVYAHRGGAALRPENTIAAFDNGLALGADGLEFDVRLSRDGVVVVHHDATLERTTNLSGPVADRTAAELAGADAGYHFVNPAGDAPFRGQGMSIPTLREVLERYPAAPMIIELKGTNPELARGVVAEVGRAGAVERVAVGSFSGRMIGAVRRCEPRLATGATREETRWALYRSWIHWPLRHPRYREFQIPERAGRTTVVSPRFVRHAHRAGVAVKVWTVDDPADMTRLLDWGVDGLITDRPDLAAGIVGSHRQRADGRGAGARAHAARGT
jgi:glycerophosphoryl diester phosphodiesterase